MIATAFDEENCVLDKPAEMSAEDCEALSVFRGIGLNTGVPIVVSCWKPEPDEWEEMKRTGRVWLVIAGDTMPPAFLAGINPLKGRIT